MNDARGTDGRQCPQARNLRGALQLFLRFGSPRTLAVLLGGWLAARFWAGPVGVSDILVVLGVALYWPWQEWALHMWLLHWRPRTILGVRVDPYAARTHRYHHRNPWILEGVFLPVSVPLVLTPVQGLLWWWAMPTTALALTGAAAMTAAALLYEWTHFIAHVPYQPRSAYVRTIRRNHQMHHFKNEHYWHAFTVPLIDRLMGTGPDPAEVDKSETVRTLGIDDRT